MEQLKGKVKLTAQIELLTGLHIGTSVDFSAIGAVDNFVVREKVSNRPMIPGSSLKGKMRRLLERVYADNSQSESDVNHYTAVIHRLFGLSSPQIINARLQFFDQVLTDQSASMLDNLELDLPYTEIKFENTINKATGEANPRQQERVPAGAIFSFDLNYAIENEAELAEDIQMICQSIALLEDDYLGGHGTRGYGRLRFKDLQANITLYNQNLNADAIRNQVNANIKR